ncbi:MAG: alpha/beta hydrolase-fold protein, partial [Gammaproteobacteria bacterium]|nr:alpha/beta hydrolase-fold protein [Gammaproteobacteria bacterium]
RSAQKVPLSDAYARFLLDEILPEVGKDYNLVDDPQGRAIGGMSDGGLASFTAAWERPDAFSKVISHIGSYTRLRGGSEYPYLIRKTRGNPKPIRVFLQDGMNDLNLTEGNWTLANLGMESALMFARYDYRFEMGTGGHDLAHGGAIFPDTLRWIWRDYPGVKGAGVVSSPDAVVGRWDMVTNILGKELHGTLTISSVGDALTARLDDEDGEIEVSAISFEDGILTYEYGAPQSQMNYWAKPGEASATTLKTWLKVTGDTFKGALSKGALSSDGTIIDFAVRGERRNGTTEGD